MTCGVVLPLRSTQVTLVIFGLTLRVGSSTACQLLEGGGDYGTADSTKQSPSAISAKAFENSLTNSHQVELRVSLLGRELCNFLGQLFYHPFVLQSREKPLSAPILYKIQPSDFGLYMYNPN